MSKLDNLECFFRRNDDSGHIYFIPKELIIEFDRIMDMGEDGEQEFFERCFDEYRYGGSDYDLELWIDPKQFE